MRTTDTMSSEAREVLLEVYINGALYSAYGCFPLDDEDVQLEFEITDAIYDLLGCGASPDVDVKLQVVMNDQVSISYCSPGEMRLQLEVNEIDNISVCEVNDVLLEMNRNELKNPTIVIYAEDLREPAGALVHVEKNRPTESTKAMKVTKFHDFVITKKSVYATVRNIKKISISAWPEVDLRVPEPEPEGDLVDAVELYSPGSDVSEPEPNREWDVVDSVKLYAPGPNVPQPKWDRVVPEISRAPGPSVPKPEAKVDSELSKLENYVPLNVFQLEDCLKKCTPLKQRHVTNVWPRVFIGDEEIATDRDALQEMCITHVLNAASPKNDPKHCLGTFNDDDIEGSVNTRSSSYRGLHINYYSLPTADRHCSDIREYFMSAASFIDKALDIGASKVLVCCKQGVEHSATLFLAYLMICHDMMLEEAIDHVIKSRRIRPSRDDLKKLMLLNVDLVQQRKLKLQDITTGSQRNKS